MGDYTCQYGVVHKTCRCPKQHSVACDNPKEHATKQEDEHGTWLYREADQHKCIKPEYTKGVRIGDKWQCNYCKIVWIVDKIDYDQRDNWTGIRWKQEVRNNSGYWRD